MLTEILLDVTNTEIESVAKEVYYRAKNKAAKGTLLPCIHIHSQYSIKIPFIVYEFYTVTI